jgi:hypothetical protein
MVLIALAVGVILIVAAIRNSHADLFSAIAQDVPHFIVWAAAIVAIGVIGFAPGLKPISRGLLALILVVLILQNYRQVLAGFQNAWKNPPPVVIDNSTAGQQGTGAIGGIGLLNQVSPYILNNFGSGSGFGGFGASGMGG